MKIRDATVKDTEQWCAMRSELWPDSRDDHAQEIADYFSGDSIDIRQAYIAEVGTEVVGFLELNIRNFAEGSRRPEIPYVEAVYIKPQYRGNGFARSLMQLAEHWATGKGYTELASDTDVDNERSIAMHRQLGFTETERIVCFLKNLAGRS